MLPAAQRLDFAVSSYADEYELFSGPLFAIDGLRKHKYVVLFFFFYKRAHIDGNSFKIPTCFPLCCEAETPVVPRDIITTISTFMDCVM